MADRPLRPAIGFGVLAAVVLAVLGVALLHVPLGWAVLLALPAGAALALLLGAPVPGEHGWPPRPESPRSLPNRRFAVLQDRLVEAADDDERFRSRIRPELCRIALFGLRQRPDTRDITALTDPRARAVLGEELHALLTAPDATQPSPARLSTVLDRLERL